MGAEGTTALHGGGKRRRVHLLIGGRVQAVGFRESARMMAERLDLGGWVRNLPDGRVEAELEGAPSDVARAVAWCLQGPPDARVAGVELAEQDPRGEVRFAVRPSLRAWDVR